MYGYDALGNLVYRKNPDSYSATWTYTTSFNRVSTATDELNHSTSFGYDSAGNTTSSTDAAGYVTSYTVNSRGLPTSITTPDPDGTGPLSAAVTSFAYDSYGRVTTLTNPDSTTRTFGYNTADMCTSETDELSHSTSFVYDTLNRLTSRTDRVGAQTTYRLQRGQPAHAGDRCAGERDRLRVQQPRMPDPTVPARSGRRWAARAAVVHLRVRCRGALVSQGEPGYSGVPLSSLTTRLDGARP